jgi:hypothetical protein
VRQRARTGVIIAAVLAGLVLGYVLLARSPGRTGPTGLFSTLPILWAENATISDALKNDAPPHWAKAALARRGAVVPFDNLSRIEGIRVLVMAQPRPLSPQENVALDGWVRGGGRLLLLADPMLTAPSAFAPGDRRRPQDVVLISPLLSHWGLRLEVDDVQAFGAHPADLFGVPVTVNLPGRLVVTDAAQGCTAASHGLAAECRIGKGRALIVADAALLEQGDDMPTAAREAALDTLLDRVAARD